VRPLPGNELCYLSIREASQLLRRRKISPVELLNATLERIERLNPELNAFITIAAERALEDARRAQRDNFRSKTTSKRKESAPPPVRKFFRISFPTATPT
jgi:Asp-tRNA(Asn)/Glu-tRNA(Gln) amidotransferase A subunit family amidase